MILIIGGGISGLFTGYYLWKKGIQFTILEKEHIGGKLSSEYFYSQGKKIILENGPSVLNTNQINILSLCRDLGIKLKKTSGSFYSYTNLVNPAELKSKDGLVKDNLNVENSASYYETEYMLYNDWLKSVQKEGKYLYPVKGFSFIVKKLQKILKPYIQKGQCLKIFNQNVEKKVKIKKRGKIIYQTFSDIIICTTMRQLIQIKFSRSVLPRGVSKTMSSIRVYVKLDQKLNKLNKIFRHRVIYYPFGGLAIKISPDILLLCYTDGRNSKKFTRSENVQKCLKFFNLQNHVVKIHTAYYSDAYDLITTTKNIDVQIDKGIYQSAFPDRYNQAWLEGNLIQCQKILQRLNLS